MDDITQDTTLGDLGLTGTAGKLSGKGGRVTTTYSRTYDAGEDGDERRRPGSANRDQSKGWATRP